MNVIEVQGLRKEYRRLKKLRTIRTVAVDGLDLQVPEGGVFGFLGPNGSGKTTTIRCILGLIRPSAGQCTLLGVDSGVELHRVIGRVGSIVEAPALFSGMSGKRNLEILALIGGIDRAKIDPVLDRVGLLDRAEDRVKTYSLGMRQRLGIAAALLKDPDVLILDEPANGLDPAGIKEVRELIRSLGAEGHTVFVSSHILSEVKNTCDRVAILANGRCVATGSVHDVLSGGGAQRALVRVSDLDAAASILVASGLGAERVGDALNVDIPEGGAAEITRRLASGGHFVEELRPMEADLETVFLELTSSPESEPGR